MHNNLCNLPGQLDMFQVSTGSKLRDHRVEQILELERRFGRVPYGYISYKLGVSIPLAKKLIKLSKIYTV